MRRRATCALVAGALLMGLACGPSLRGRTLARPAWEATYTPTVGARMRGPLAALTARLAEGGITVTVVEGLEAHGLSYVPMRQIVLNAALSVDGRFEVLAHEAGHFFHPGLADPSARELFAELVGVGVQEYYGSRTARTTAAGYLVLHKHAWATYPFLRRDIEEAVRVLTGRAPWPAAPHP